MTNKALDRTANAGLAVGSAQDTAEVVASLVMRGDISGLGPEARTRYYLATCEGLGLNPNAQPFAFLRLNGKEVMYATRGATDQLAAMHRVTRRIIDGPKIVDVDGTKLVYAVCEASLPNGRVETATATLPVVDPVNMLMKCECVPLDSEILTRRGFKRHDELRIGEEVLAYDAAHNRNEWVPLENVTVFPSAPVSTFATAAGGFSFRCTPNHSWAVDTNTRAGRKLVEASAVKTHHHLRIAAASAGGHHLLSPLLAGVLGWVMCDGTVRRVGNNLRLVIYQSKPERVAEIRELLTRSGLTWQEGVGEATVRTFPGGGTSECLPQHSFRLDTVSSKRLFDEAGIEGPADMPRLATHLSAPARLAMLKAMMAADGTANGSFGKKRKPGVMEAWQILCTLEGVALGKMGTSSVGEVPVQRMLSYDYVAGSNLALTPDGIEAVWCPTTKHGTWVMRQNGRITITGNTKAKRRATLSILGLAILDEMETETIPGAERIGAARVEHQQLNPVDDAPAEPAAPSALDSFRTALDDASDLAAFGEAWAAHALSLGGTKASAINALIVGRATACGYHLIADEAHALCAGNLDADLAAAYDALAAVTLSPDDEDGDGVIADVVRVMRRASGLRTDLKKRVSKVGVATAEALGVEHAKARITAALNPPPPPTGTDGPARGSSDPVAPIAATVAANAQHATAQASAEPRVVLDDEHRRPTPHKPEPWQLDDAAMRAHIAGKGSRTEIERAAACHGEHQGPAFLTLLAAQLVAIDRAYQRRVHGTDAAMSLTQALMVVERCALNGRWAREAKAAQQAA